MVVLIDLLPRTKPWLDDPPVEQQLEQLLTPPVQHGHGSPAAWLPGILDLQVQWQGGFDFDYQVPALSLLVPGSIISACPNLTRLRWSGFHIRAPARQPVVRSSSQQQPQQLQRLELACTVRSASAGLMQQLQALTQLQQLHMPSIGWVLPPDPMKQLAMRWTGGWQSRSERRSAKLGGFQQYAVALAASLSARLTSLTWTEFDDEGCSYAATTALLRASWPRLTQLDLGMTVMGDAAVQLLLQEMPQLQQLQVYAFQLHNDHHGQACSWQQLCMCQVHVASLTRLPLSRVTSLQALEGSRSTVLLVLADSGDALQVTSAAVAAAAGCGGLRLRGLHGRPPTVSVTVPQKAAAHMQRVLQATLPLLQHMPSLSLKGAQVTCSLLTSLGQAMPHCARLVLVSCHHQSPLVWGSLLSLLPHLNHLGVVARETTLQQMGCHLLATASRPLRVEVDLTGQGIGSRQALLRGQKERLLQQLQGHVPAAMRGSVTVASLRY